MSMTPSESTNIRPLAASGDASTIRRPVSGVVRNAPAFGETLEGMTASIELSMANRLLESSMAIDMGEPGENSGSLGGFGLDVLSTLTRLTRQEALASATREVAPLIGMGGSSARTDAMRRYAAQAAQLAGTSQDISTEPLELVAETPDESMLGALSSRFESGPLGSLTIGHDRVGGTSYGIYQISSRQGSMKEFISFLSEKAPDLARRLRAAGPSDTGSGDGRMPKVWKQIAKELGPTFDDLQHQFIARSHYEPALERVKELTGLDEASMPQALREVLFSTAVQHGPGGAGSIFARAAGKLKARKDDGFNYLKQLVDSVYELRSRQFGGSSEGVRNAVKSRLVQERQLALDMLKHDSGLSESMLA